jgi:threonine synthase
VREAGFALARAGVFAEPASAAAVAALTRLDPGPEQLAVGVITGNGLKWPSGAPAQTGRSLPWIVH